MELDLGPEITQFRAELRAWIAGEAPAGLAGLGDCGTALTAGARRAARLATARADPGYAEWAGNLPARRLICPQSPKEFGGRGMDAVRLAARDAELDLAGMPRVSRGMGESTSEIQRNIIGERAPGLPKEPRLAR